MTQVKAINTQVHHVLMCSCQVGGWSRLGKFWARKRWVPWTSRGREGWSTVGHPKAAPVSSCWARQLTSLIGLLRGGVPRGGGSLIFPKLPQSSQTESLGFPRNTPSLGHPGTLKNPTGGSGFTPRWRVSPYLPWSKVAFFWGWETSHL